MSPFAGEESSHAGMDRAIQARSPVHQRAAFVMITGPDQGSLTSAYGSWMTEVFSMTMKRDDVVWTGQSLSVQIQESPRHAGSISQQIAETLSALRNPPEDDSILERCRPQGEPDAEGLFLWLFGVSAGHRRGQQSCSIDGLRGFWAKMLEEGRFAVFVWSPDWQEAERVLNCTSMAPASIRWPSISLPEGFNHVYTDTTRLSNEVTSFFHVGKCSPERLSTYWLLENVANDVPFTDSDVSLAGKLFGSDVWVQVQVQSNKESTVALDSSIERFLTAMQGYLAIQSCGDWAILQERAELEQKRAEAELRVRDLSLLFFTASMTGDFSELSLSAFRSMARHASETPPSTLKVLYHQVSLHEARECFNKYLGPGSKT
jgi:hypothetical protein